MARKRAPKGSVTIRQRGKYLQLRWRFGGKEHNLAAGLNNPLNHFNARELATQIERDIAIGQFDPTLKKYRPKPIEPEPVKLTTVELFQQFIEHRRKAGTSEQAISTRYRSMLANLQRFKGDIVTEGGARKFVDVLRSRQSPKIANQNLSLLKSFADWAVKQGLIDANPFESIGALKAPKTPSETRQPFSRAEIKALLQTCKTHPKLYQWHDFCMVLLFLGLRPSEAIGLRWQDVDLSRGQITIASSLARDGEGRSRGTARVRKSTKTGSSRILPLPESLLVMLKGRAAATVGKPGDLIFLSPKGKPIDDHSFSQRVWKKLCTAANVPYRVPYACRHSVLSHGIESGTLTMQQAAYVAGHSSTRMVNETYGHMIDRPKLIDWLGD